MKRLLSIALLTLSAMVGCNEQSPPSGSAENEPKTVSPKPTTAQEETPQQEQQTTRATREQGQRSLCDRAVLQRTPPYEIEWKSDSGQRLDVAALTEYTRDKAKLGAVLVDIQQDSGADLVTAGFCVSMKACSRNETFAYGSFATTPQGKSFLTGEEVLSEVGTVPYMQVDVF